MFGLDRKQPDVLSHWFALVDNFQYSSQSFYASVEEELRNRDAPGLVISKVEHREGGALSHKRIYLRLSRERFAFDLCAAPFGRTFFFSLRFMEVPRGGWLRIIIPLLLVALVVEAQTMATQAMRQGIFWGVGVAVAVSLLVWLLSSSPSESRRLSDGVKSRWPDLDTFLIRLPGFGALYESLRRDTYYREDTRLMYLTLVSDIVKKKVDEVTAAKGVKLIRSYERSPILGELYKPSESKPAPVDTPAGG